MKNMWLSTVVHVSALVVSGTAHARGGGSGVLFDVNLYYGASATDQKLTNGSESKSDDKTSLYDIKLGYLSGSGLYFGGIYSSRSYTALSAAGENGSSLGGSLGYFGSSGFFVMGHYIASSTRGEYT